ncbi:hypothetical protein Hypma_002912 [Hypsizygus marmoreus]|uniref:Uncharacterized protein n=1 Tax=Hypsizygus marmoreus TaxID=39966 RepID=A0A369J3C5_HYPMA|nr:hypothetical protein Hypma_002912 [Hypsizygus marmoreus]
MGSALFPGLRSEVASLYAHSMPKPRVLVQAKRTQFETKLSAVDEQIAKKRDLKMAEVATAWVASKRSPV